MMAEQKSIADRQASTFRFLIAAPLLVAAGLLGLLVQLPEAAASASKGWYAAFAVFTWSGSFLAGAGLAVTSFPFFGSNPKEPDRFLFAIFLLSLACSGYALFVATMIIAEWMKHWPV